MWALHRAALLWLNSDGVQAKHRDIESSRTISATVTKGCTGDTPRHAGEAGQRPEPRGQPVAVTSQAIWF